MKEIIDPVDTEDGLFHDGDPSTGAEGTIVYAKIMNALQGGVISNQQELASVLKEAGIPIDPTKQDQLLTAIKSILGSGTADKAKSADKLSTARKIAGHDFDGTADISISASDVGALPDTYTAPVTSVNTKTGAVVLAASDVGAVSTGGGSVDHLDNARYYNTRSGMWQGGGAFVNQLGDGTAPFCVPKFTVPNDTSMYLPICKGISNTDVHDYSSAVSFGVLRSGAADFGAAIIQIIGDNGTGAIYTFQNNGTFVAPGPVLAGNASLAQNGDVSGPAWGGGYLSAWLNNQFASANNLAQDAWNKANDAQNNSVRDSRRGPQQYINPGENGIWNGFEIPNGYFSGTRNHTDDGNAKFNEYYYRVQQIYIPAQGWVDTGTL
ncbi:hypothetical protein [Yokenella regensburgei]|uniref:hypothetical protein n=1 Tax=Yokenella regensburgei TaxID=158877 RepID=UPI003EDA0990